MTFDATTNRPLTEAEVATAMVTLADLDTLVSRYTQATNGRSLISDWYAQSQINGFGDDENVANADATMRAFIDSGHAPSVFGDDHWAEASYYGFQDEVRLGVSELGHWIEDADDE